MELPSLVYSLQALGGRLLAFYDDKGHFREVSALNEADGVDFKCPKCFKKDHDAEYPHMVTLWFSSLGEERSRKLQGHPGWNKSGKDLHDLTFVSPGAVSVLLKGGCRWHGFVKNGTASIL